jgi:hypothetical protein
MTKTSSHFNSIVSDPDWIQIRNPDPERQNCLTETKMQEISRLEERHVLPGGSSYTVAWKPFMEV